MAILNKFVPEVVRIEPRADGLRVLVLLRPESDRTEILAALKPLSNMDVQTFLRPKQLTAEMVTKAKTPSVLVLDADLSSQGDLDLIRELKDGPCARIPLVVLADRVTHLASIKAIRAGADDVVLKPIDPAEAHEVFARVGSAATSEEKSFLGKVIVFMHLVGGAGATTLAVNSASMLSSMSSTSDTCLLDLDMQYGNAASLLDLPTTSPIQELIAEPDRLDREMLERMMVKHAGDSVRVLTAPSLPLPLNALQASGVTTLLQTARRAYKYVVVDLPVALASWTDAVLKEATVIYVVCPPTVAAVHRFAQLRRLLQHEELTGLPIKIVLNRHQTPKRNGDISSSQFSKSVGRHVAHTIPNDYALISLSHNQGKAAVQLKPRGAFSDALFNMLRADLGSQAFADAPQRRSFFGIGY